MDELRTHLFSIAALLGLLVFAGAFTIFYIPSTTRAPHVITLTASSTLAVVPSTVLPSPLSPPALPIVLPQIPKVTGGSVPPATVTTPTHAVSPAPQPVSPAPPTPQATLAPTAAEVNADLSLAATTLRSALVNILCYAPVGSDLRSISGSGIIIDPKGIILTNAHIAEYFLFADRGVSCHIRTGSPATDAYTASLIYLPSKWVEANADVLTKANPTGTGEYDFALVGITGSLSSTPPPSVFSFIPLSTRALFTGAPVVLGSYGAQFLDASQIQSALAPTIVYGSVKNIYTFAQNSVDVLALGGSAAAQEGSSGGGVLNAANELAGTITTSTVVGATDTRALNAITSTYIRSEYARETGQSIDALLAEPTDLSISQFAPSMAGLEVTLTAHL